MKQASVAVIIPMFNEEKGAGRCIRSVISEIRKFPNKVRLIVVNDGSRDKTEQIILSEQKKYGKYLSLVSYAVNKGYGKALREGIRKALQEKFDYALFMDSDLTNNPKDIGKFIGKLDLNPDCVKASRYIPGGSMKNVPFKRIAISKIANLFASMMFRLGINDCTNGFRMTRLSKLRKFKFKENSFAIILEELYYLKKNASNVLEVPVNLTSRTGSKSHFSYNPSTFYNYGKYAIKALFLSSPHER